MPLIQARDREYLAHEFDQLSHAVKLVLFTSQQGCEYCTEIRQIVTEVAELSPKLSFEEYDVQQAPELAAQYKVDKTPALVVMRGGESPKDYGIRYYGIPSGYEFSSFIHSILMVGKGESGLSAEVEGMGSCADTACAYPSVRHAELSVLSASRSAGASLRP
jgi:alkyl hydroperoxide reductase subunit AhpF